MCNFWSFPPVLQYWKLNEFTEQFATSFWLRFFSWIQRRYGLNCLISGLQTILLKLIEWLYLHLSTNPKELSKMRYFV